ncbi:MAG: DNA-binding transcriptional activator of the family, partial [Chthonomonadales bacterium]|nr:DNA-binding transcriptional activator of the family [Chthonomonadales bacterium]
MAHTLWYFELLGRFRAESHARSVERFRTQKTASFLAYLVLHADQPQSREALIDRFWQDSTPEAGQTNLRVALNSLRKQFEPPGIPANSLLIATRESIQIAADGIDTDVAQFENAVRRAQTATDTREQLGHWSEAIGFYKGRLLPALYDDWILREQQHLETLYLTALHKMIALCVQVGDVGTALEYALRAVDTDPLNEELHAEVLRLYVAAAQPSAAVRHYQQLEKTLREQLDSVPSRETRALIEPWMGAQAVAKPRTPTPPPPSKVTPTPLPPQEAAFLPPPRPTLSPALPPRTGPLYGREEACRWVQERLQSENTSVLTLMGPG